MLVGYSNYQQCVEIVCCWHSWFTKKGYDGSSFDHYPSRKTAVGNTITPDFVVDFPKNNYTLIGEVCRLPDQQQGFEKSVSQAKSYTEYSDNTDVIMLIPLNDAAAAEKRMVANDLLGEEQESEPVVIISYARIDNDVVPKWIFSRPAGPRKVIFRDTFLDDKHSLHNTFNVSLETITVVPKYVKRMLVNFPICNDDPPPLFLACVLWQRVFPGMLKEDKFIKHRARQESLNISTSLSAIRKKANEKGIKTKKGCFESAVALLTDAGLIEKISGEKSKYIIKFGLVRSRGVANDLHEKIALILAKPKKEVEIRTDQLEFEIEA
ncbi:MAG: hypothetical protein ACYC5A_09555 [Thermoleophilia bacterium]